MDEFLVFQTCLSHGLSLTGDRNFSALTMLIYLTLSFRLFQYSQYSFVFLLDILRRCADF